MCIRDSFSIIRATVVRRDQIENHYLIGKGWDQQYLEDVRIAVDLQFQPNWSQTHHKQPPSLRIFTLQRHQIEELEVEWLLLCASVVLVVAEYAAEYRLGVGWVDIFVERRSDFLEMFLEMVQTQINAKIREYSLRVGRPSQLTLVDKWKWQLGPNVDYWQSWPNSIQTQKHSESDLNQIWR